MNFNKETIGSVVESITNGINCKQNKKGVGVKISRIETIADRKINYQKTGFCKLNENDKKKYKLKKGDILFSHINSPIHVGKTAIYDGDEDLYHGVNLLKIKVKKHISPYYFKYFLDGIFQSGYWKKTSKQSVNQASVNQTDIKKIDFFYPSLEEQKHIVAKLDAAFAEIKKVIELVQKQLIETELLYKSKLRNYFKNSFETRQPLYKLCTITSSKRIMKKDYVEEGIPFLRTKEVKQLAHNQPITTKLFISKEQYYSLRDKFGAPKEDDILFTAIGTIGEVYIVKDNDEFYFKDGNILWLKDLINVSPDYLRYGLLSFVENINTLAHGAAYSALPIQRLKAFEIPVPSIKEQSDIVNSLENLFQQIKTLKSTLNSKLLAITNLKSAILKKELQQDNSEAA